MDETSVDRLSRWLRPKKEDDSVLLALGAMNFGKRTSAAESERIVARAVERGVTLVDTANAYTDGESERIVGRAIQRHRDQVLIATKVGSGRVNGRPEGLSRNTMLHAIDQSLSRLASDYVDIYYLHVPDHHTPIEQTVDTLAELLASGKIRHFAISNYASWQILEIMNLCDERGIEHPVMGQHLYNLLIRQLDIEYFRFAKHYSLHTTVYNVLAGGLLTGRYRPGDPIAKGSRFDKNSMYQRRYWSNRFLEVVEDYGRLAAQEGMSLLEFSYAWAAGAKGVDSILLGPASVDQLDAAMDGCAKQVSDEARTKAQAIYQAFAGTDATYAR